MHFKSTMNSSIKNSILHFLKSNGLIFPQRDNHIHYFASMEEHSTQPKQKFYQCLKQREKNLNLTEPKSKLTNLIKVYKIKLMIPPNAMKSGDAIRKQVTSSLTNKLGEGIEEKEKTKNRLKEIPITQCMHLLRIRFKTEYYIDRDFLVVQWLAFNVSNITEPVLGDFMPQQLRLCAITTKPLPRA